MGPELSLMRAGGSGCTGLAQGVSGGVPTGCPPSGVLLSPVPHGEGQRSSLLGFWKENTPALCSQRGAPHPEPGLLGFNRSWPPGGGQCPQPAPTTLSSLRGKSLAKPTRAACHGCSPGRRLSENTHRDWEPRSHQQGPATWMPVLARPH